VGRWAVTATNAGATKRRRAPFRVRDVGLVIWGVKIHAVPAAVLVSIVSTLGMVHDTYVGYRMFDRIPPGQAVLGKPSVSSLEGLVCFYTMYKRGSDFASAQGAALSPPKFGAL
jgi:hypothetical protein